MKSILTPHRPLFWVILAAALVFIGLGTTWLVSPKEREKKDEEQTESTGESISGTGSGEEVTNSAAEDRILVYYYSGNTLEAGKMITFWIALHPSGSYAWYDTPISSYIGSGSWVIEDGILTMTERPYYIGEKEARSMVNRFRVEDDKLIFLAQNSSNFGVKLEDGEIFLLGNNPLGKEWEFHDYPGLFDTGDENSSDLSTP